MAQDSGKVVSLTHRPLFAPRKYSWYSFLFKMIKHENTVNYFKAQRLSWFGHVQRLPETGAAKKIFKRNPLTTRPRGRPKHRWEDNIIKDLGQIMIKIWVTGVQDRSKWKVVVERTKLPIKGGSAPEEETHFC